jgi:HK97 family phage portal protein
VGLWYLPPSRVRIEPSRTERIARYIYEYQGFSHEFMPGEIVHFRRPSLDDDFYGESLLESIENDIATDIHMSLFQLRFFGTDNATPAGMVGAPSSMTHEQFKQFKEEYYEQFGSGKRRTLVYQQGDENEEITYTPMGAKHEEMEFLASREATRKTILERFGISTGMLSEASTEAHARVAERNFLRACYYRHRAVAERINKDIMPFYGDYLFRFEDVRTGDSQQLLQRRQASEGILTVNEQRREFFGVEPIENQEDLNDASSTNDA